jgi:hypothetical protein
MSGNDQKFCPQCGKEVDDTDTFCPICGTNLKSGESPPPTQVPTESFEPRQEKRSATEHLKVAYNVAMSQPMVFLPAIIGGIISTAISWTIDFGDSYGTIGIILNIISWIISFILSFASLDMSRDAYVKQQLDLGSSVSYVTGRIAPLFIASIVGAVLTIFIIPIPIVIIMNVIIVLDETTFSVAISKAIEVLKQELGDVILIIIISIVGAIALFFVPFIGSLLGAALNVLIGIAYIDLYTNYKNINR